MLFPFNSLVPYDIHKLSQTSTVGENFGSFVANYVISEKRWQSLPAGVQAALTKMGEEIVRSTCAQVERDEAGDIAHPVTVCGKHEVGGAGRSHLLFVLTPLCRCGLFEASHFSKQQA